MADLLEAPGPFVVVPAGYRHCSRCGTVKPVDEFPMKNKARGLRRVWCRDCCHAYGREHYRKNKPAYLAKADRRRAVERPRVRTLIDAYLREHPCLDCGCTEITVLEFDHRDPTEKELPVGELARWAEWPRVLREIEKCDVRCANCHRRRTAQQMHWRKDPERGALAAADIASLGPVLTRPSSTGRPVTEQLSVWDVGRLRRCYACGEWKPLHDFSFRKRRTGERQGYCRACQAAYRRDHYCRNRPAYIERAMAQVKQRREEQVRVLHEYLRTHPCVDCSETNIGLLEFDHVDSAAKEMDIGVMLGRRPWAKILDEIAKCDVRCANCHRKRTAAQQGWKCRLAEDRGRYGRLRLPRVCCSGSKRGPQPRNGRSIRLTRSVTTPRRMRGVLPSSH